MRLANCHPDRKHEAKGLCRHCYFKAKTKEWRDKNSDRAKELAEQWYEKNADSAKKRASQWKKENPDRAASIHKKWASGSPDKIRANNLSWHLKNPGKRKAMNAKRRASKLRQTPPWAELKAIEMFYINCPAGHEVDHIIPLQGVDICGLHVLSNLQYLTVSQNRSKSNKACDTSSRIF
jgi:hypothetical protein